MNYYEHRKHAIKSQGLTSDEMADDLYYRIISRFLSGYEDGEFGDSLQAYNICREYYDAINESGMDRFLDRIYDTLKVILEPAQRFNGHPINKGDKITILTVPEDNADPEFPLTLYVGIVEGEDI